MKKCYMHADRVALTDAVKRGDSVRSAASRLGVGISTAYLWMREATSASVELARPPVPTFVEVMPSSQSLCAVLVVHVGIADIEVRSGFDPALLRAVVGALAESA